MYMYSVIVASLASGILYLTSKTTKEVVENNFEKTETLQNRPVVDKVSEVDKKQFFDTPKTHKNKSKNFEKVMTEPFEQ